MLVFLAISVPDPFAQVWWVLGLIETVHMPILVASFMVVVSWILDPFIVTDSHFFSYRSRYICSYRTHLIAAAGIDALLL